MCASERHAGFSQVKDIQYCRTPKSFFNAPRPFTHVTPASSSASCFAGETPAKVREDLEKSLTELNNLSLSICNSEVSCGAIYTGLLYCCNVRPIRTIRSIVAVSRVCVECRTVVGDERASCASLLHV